LESGQVDALHLVVTGPATKVLAHELGPEWASARGLRDNLSLSDGLRERIRPYQDSELIAAGVILAWQHRAVVADGLDAVGTAFFTANGTLAVCMSIFFVIATLTGS